MSNGTRRHQPRGAWGALVAGGLAVVTLAACGGSDGSTGASTTARSPSTTRAVTAAVTTTGAPLVTTTVPPPVTTVAASTATTTAYTAEPSTGALKRGMKGNRVAAVQSKLAALGYDPGPADGLFGGKTDAAVRKFQTDQSLAIDGVVGNQTIAALDAACKAKAVC